MCSEAVTVGRPTRRCFLGRATGATLLLLCIAPSIARAAERVTLRTGFTVTCERHTAVDTGHVRLYLDAGSTQFLDVAASSIDTVESIANAPTIAAALAASVQAQPSAATSKAEPVAQAQSQPVAQAQSQSVAQAQSQLLDALIRTAGEARRINVDLLRSVVNAESGGHVRAVSKAGAQGLMQLMPGTARTLGVTDSFAPEQNLRGGTDYLDMLLRRYHDDLSLALAAYNAGPGAVDRYRGIPPYRETQLYVARIIHEFNRRTLLAQRSAIQQVQSAAAHANGAAAAR